MRWLSMNTVLSEPLKRASLKKKTLLVFHIIMSAEQYGCGMIQHHFPHKSEFFQHNGNISTCVLR